MVYFHFFCIHISNFPNTICWRDCLYPMVCSCLLYQILIDCKDLVLFLGSLFCSIGLCACFYASARLFWLQWPYNTVWYQVLWSLLLCSFFLKIDEAIWGCLWFHTHFWNVCSVSVKFAIGTLIVFVLNLWIALGSMDILIVLILPSMNTVYASIYCVFLNLFLQCCVVFWVQVFYLAISHGFFFLISVSDI